MPALDRRIVGEIDVAPLRAPDPREGDDVGHAVFLAREIGGFLQPVLEDPMQAFDFVGVALDRIRDFFDGIGREWFHCPNIGPIPPI